MSISEADDRPIVFIAKFTPTRDVEQPVHALRALLKALLRRHGFKCISCEEVRP